MKGSKLLSPWVPHEGEFFLHTLLERRISLLCEPPHSCPHGVPAGHFEAVRVLGSVAPCQPEPFCPCLFPVSFCSSCPHPLSRSRGRNLLTTVSLRKQRLLCRCPRRGQIPASRAAGKLTAKSDWAQQTLPEAKGEAAATVADFQEWELLVVCFDKPSCDWEPGTLLVPPISCRSVANGVAWLMKVSLLIVDRADKQARSREGGTPAICHSGPRHKQDTKVRGGCSVEWKEENEREKCRDSGQRSERKPHPAAVPR